MIISPYVYFTPKNNLIYLFRQVEISRDGELVEDEEERANATVTEQHLENFIKVCKGIMIISVFFIPRCNNLFIHKLILLFYLFL